MIRIYGVPSCDKIKKTLKLLDHHKIEYEFVNVRKIPVEKEKLKGITDTLGLDRVLNRQGMLYRKLGLKEKNLTPGQLFEQLFNEQGMIKRPLIEFQGKFHIGYDEEKILQFLK